MAAGHGLVKIKGSMSGLYLVPVGKLKLMKPGEVPAGEYNIQQKVGASYSTLGKVTVVAGQTHVLNCDSIMMICR